MGAAQSRFSNLILNSNPHLWQYASKFNFQWGSMKILVPVKRVVDPYVKVRVKSDHTGVETNVKMAMNPFDEIALEEAIRLQEKKIAGEIVVVSIGDDASQETLRHGLALGADR